MRAQIDVLHSSTIGTVLHFRCLGTQGSVSTPEHSKTFSVNFTRQGNFCYRIGKNAYDIHSGVVLLEGAYCERVVTHPSSVKDECIVLELKDEFIEQLGADCDANRHKRLGFFLQVGRASVLPVTPRLEYLHSSISKAARGNFSVATLKVDVLLVDVLQEICIALGECPVEDRLPSLVRRTKEHHLETIDRAKRFIVANFRNQVSLLEIARHAHASVFHFSRLFKHFTSRSPHQYLIDVRMKHAALLLRNTSLSVTEVCFDSGFNSLEHFIATFNERYSSSPSKYRRRK